MDNMSMWVREWHRQPQWAPDPERDWSAGDKLLVWLLALIWILGPAWILALHDDYRPESYFRAAAMASPLRCGPSSSAWIATVAAGQRPESAPYTVFCGPLR